MRLDFKNTRLLASKPVYFLVKISCLIVFFSGFWDPSVIYAQTTIQLLGAAPGGGSSGSGPTTTAQTVTLYTNATTPYAPTTTATFTFSNQQFATTEGNPTVPGMTFGTNVQSSNNNNSAANLAVSNPVYDLMNVISGPANANFTSCNACTAGTGVDITTTRAVALLNSSDAFIDASGNSTYAMNSRVYMGDLTITFNKPVNNPILHIVGLGGTFFYGTENPGGSGNWTYYDIGFTSELDLITSGISLSKKSGNSVFTVSSNSIQNTSAQYGSGTTASSTHGVSRQAATGSVAVQGMGITTMTFKVYLKGDGGTIRNAAGTVVAANNGNILRWSLPLNFIAGGGSVAQNGFSGDKYMIGVTLQPCQQVVTPSANQSVCLGQTGSNITVNTDINTANSIRFVKFTSDQMAGATPTSTEAAAIYAGTAIATVTPTGSSSPYTATYPWNSADFPTAGTYYVYAILNPNPGGDCYPVQEIQVVIKPLPSVTAPSNQSLCKNGTTTAVTFSGSAVSGTTYNWTNNTTSIGLAASGTGNIAAFTATNTTSNPIVATITVTPTANGCLGTPQNFTITVNPTPSVNIVTTTSSPVCVGASTTLNATTAGGSGGCTIQWQSSPDGTTWTNISGATASGYTTAPGSTLRYRVQLLSCVGSGCCN